ncbi:hypothetical protein [Amycolatopsis pigmentata]|uniref:Uncharacterized protein n=1 Tax=Amycolatopsis pigmentata TaxID=450801 RepID=A0ABW5FMH3_9PSEU
MTVRHWCHLQAGDRVLLAAAPDRGVLIVSTMSALDSMVTAFHSASTGGDAS